MKSNKPKISITSLTCCEGCQIAIFDLGERFLKLLANVKVGDFPLAEDLPEPKEFDIAIVEGTPITKQNIAKIKALRQKSRYLIALGACACLGGVQALKNTGDKTKALTRVYPQPQGLDNPDIKPISAFVKVDLEIPGCPINKQEFYELISQLLKGRQPKLAQYPVCYQCQLRENGCLLQQGLPAGRQGLPAGRQGLPAGRQGLPCLGPITLGGCNAPCPSAGMACDACRGLLPNANLDNMKKALRQCKNDKTQCLEYILERFGNEKK